MVVGRSTKSSSYMRIVEVVEEKARIGIGCDRSSGLDEEHSKMPREDY